MVSIEKCENVRCHSCLEGAGRLYFSRKRNAEVVIIIIANMCIALIMYQPPFYVFYIRYLS